MAKFAIKFLIAGSVLSRLHHRKNWYPGIAVVSTLVTIALIALYLSRRGTAG